MDVNKIWGLLSGKVDNWFEIAIKNLPNVVVAVVVLCIFYFFSKIFARVLEKFLVKITAQRSVRNLTLSFSRIAIVLVGLFIALEILHLEKAVTSLLAGAGVIGLALGFAFQDIAANFVSGIFIAFNKPYQIGDIVETGSYLGNVTAINLRTTTLTTFQGLDVLVPNRMLFTDPIINYTNTPKRRIDLAVGVSYGESLQAVESLLKKELEALPNRLESKEIDVFFTEFGGSSINLEVRIWVKYPDHRNFLITKSEAIKKIKSIFDENDISIPFPIRTLDFGIKGGEKLSENLSDELNL